MILAELTDVVGTRSLGAAIVQDSSDGQYLISVDEINDVTS